jgi:acetyl esterase/lipase
MYMAKLQDSGVKTHVQIYEGMIHGFINRAHQKTYECLDRMCGDINS